MNISPLELARGMDVKITEDYLTVSLKDGRVISTPLIWYPRLSKASSADLAVWEWHGDGDGICWPLLDEDLSIKGMLEGNPSIEYERQARRAAA
jgi:hypothetical protein